LAIAIIFVSLSLSYAQQTKTFTTKRLNYRIDYPSNYQIKIINEVVSFVSSVKDKKFAFSPNVNVVTINLDNTTTTPQELVESGKARLLKFLWNVQFQEEGKEKINGKDAYRVVYTSKQSKANFKFLEVIIVHKKRAYSITYTSLLEEYDRAYKQARSIINSFKTLE
jgi:hypothetical protein